MDSHLQRTKINSRRNRVHSCPASTVDTIWDQTFVACCHVCGRIGITQCLARSPKRIAPKNRWRLENSLNFRAVLWLRVPSVRFPHILDLDRITWSESPYFTMLPLSNGAKAADARNTQSTRAFLQQSHLYRTLCPMKAMSTLEAGLGVILKVRLSEMAARFSGLRLAPKLPPCCADAWFWSIEG